MFTLVALLIGLLHTAAVDSPSPSQYRWFDILFLFQTAAATGLLHLNYPLVYSNFTLNFAWAMALFRSNTMQDTINKMRVKTGGELSGQAYSDVHYIDRKLSPYNEFIDLSIITKSDLHSYMARNSRSFSDLALPFGRPLLSRAVIASAIDQNTTSELSTGLPEYADTLGIPEANAYSTVFFLLLAFVAMAIVLHIILYILVRIIQKSSGGRVLWATRLRQMWWGFCGGNALRLVGNPAHTR